MTFFPEENAVIIVQSVKEYAFQKGFVKNLCNLTSDGQLYRIMIKVFKSKP